MANNRSESRPLVAITFGPASGPLHRALGDDVELVSLGGVDEAERARILGEAVALLVWNWNREFRSGEGPSLPTKFVQLVSAGADHVPFDQLPTAAVVASNVGAYAEPMSEHALAMALALRKLLPQNHTKLAEGVWNQSLTRWLRGAVCGIVGFGGIGKATGGRMQALGARLYVINTSGKTNEPVDFAGTLDDLDTVLAASDIVVVSIPLTRRTTGLIGRRELELMKPDAILVNVARGAIVDEEALYQHLLSHPDFSAGLDVWWDEPFGSGGFHVGHPFLDLPNVLGSPHNSGLAPGVFEEALSMAAANIRRFLTREPVTGVLRAEDYVER
jgi:phosphoglycerate dehydrogenase-like enzyme